MGIPIQQIPFYAKDCLNLNIGFMMPALCLRCPARRNPCNHVLIQPLRLLHAWGVVKLFYRCVDGIGNGAEPISASPSTPAAMKNYAMDYMNWRVLVGRKRATFSDVGVPA